MKISTTAAMFVGWAAVCGAQPAAKADPVDREMKTMDTNADGRISPEEHAAGVARMFAAMDEDKDGKVTAKEMEAAHGRVTGSKPAAGEMSAAEKIKVVDTDGDGVLSAAEHTAGARAMFERQDMNKDGALSREELAAGRAMKMKK